MKRCPCGIGPDVHKHNTPEYTSDDEFMRKLKLVRKVLDNAKVGLNSFDYRNLLTETRIEIEHRLKAFKKG